MNRLPCLGVVHNGRWLPAPVPTGVIIATVTVVAVLTAARAATTLTTTRTFFTRFGFVDAQVTAVYIFAI